MGPVVCVCNGRVACLRVCYHDNSKLRASILTKLGNLQLIKFSPSRAGPRQGGLWWGEIFAYVLLQPARSVCVSLGAFFIYLVSKIFGKHAASSYRVPYMLEADLRLWSEACTGATLVLCYLRRHSAVADKPRDAFVQMQWRCWPIHQSYIWSAWKKWIPAYCLSRSLDRTDTDRLAMYDFSVL